MASHLRSALSLWIGHWLGLPGFQIKLAGLNTRALLCPHKMAESHVIQGVQANRTVCVTLLHGACVCFRTALGRSHDQVVLGRCTRRLEQRKADHHPYLQGMTLLRSGELAGPFNIQQLAVTHTVKRQLSDIYPSTSRSSICTIKPKA